MLKQTLADLAACTWADFDLAKYVLGFTPDERYFTDRNLIEITRRHRPRIFATRMNIDEHATGADFEWWIRDGAAVCGLLVQAKRLSLEDHGVYKDIDRPTKNGMAQPTRLIETARNRRMTPLYVMYNGGRPAFPMGPCRGGLPLEARGTTATAARHIKSLAAMGSHAALADVQRHAIPWQCLFGCPVARPRSSSLPERIGKVLQAYKLAESEPPTVTRFAELDPRVAGLFEMLTQLGTFDVPDGPADLLREMNALAADGAVAGAIILVDATGPSDTSNP